MAKTIREIISELSPKHKQVYSKLETYAHQTQGHIPSLRVMQEYTKIPYSTLVFIVEKFWRLGLLERHAEVPHTYYTLAGGEWSYNPDTVVEEVKTDGRKSRNKSKED